MITVLLKVSRYLTNAELYLHVQCGLVSVLSYLPA